MNKQITVTIFGQNIKDAITNGDYNVTVPVTFASSGGVENSIDIQPFLEYLSTEYIETLDSIQEQEYIDYYNDTVLIDGVLETELYFNTEYQYLCTV